MIIKRLKGLLAMVLAGSMALTALPLSASATISRDDVIKIYDASRQVSGTVAPADIQNIDGEYVFATGNLADSDCLTADNMWVVYGSFNNVSDYSSGYVFGTVTGDKLAEELYNYKTDSDKDYSFVNIKSEHNIAVTTKDLSDSNASIYNSDLTFYTVSTFPFDLSNVISNTDVDPLKYISSWTAWYNRNSGNIYDDYDEYAIHSIRINNTPNPITENISADIAEEVYKNCGEVYVYSDAFRCGKTIIQLNTAYNVFSIDVYDGWGKATTDVISVTNGDIGALIPEEATEALKGEYILVYEKDSEHISTSGQISNKTDLWEAIKVVAREFREFDENKAKLVRDVTYNVFESAYNGSHEIGSFSSLDRLNDNDTNGKQYFDSHSASGDNIWSVMTYRYAEYFDDVNAGITEVLDTTGTDDIDLYNMANIAVTAEKPNVGGEPLYTDLYDYPVNKYPTAINGIAGLLTEKVNPNAGYKYDTDNWTLWGYSTGSGAVIKCEVPVTDKSKIGFVDFQNTSYKYTEELLVYFPQTEITVAVDVAEPAKGEAPASKADVPENDGYLVTKVSWFNGSSELAAGEKFAAGKAYTVAVTLKADEGLSFIDTTSATINDETPTEKTLNQDGTMTVSYTFDALPLNGISAVALDVTAPSVGGTPATTATTAANADYTVSEVAWTPADETFKAGEQYKVSVTVAAKDGFDFTADTTATINTKSAETTPNQDGTLTVSYIFDALPLNGISAVALNVTAPSVGGTPATTATTAANADYTVTEVTWTPADETFKAGEQYKVSVTVAAKDGFEFTANTTATINSKSAETTLNNDGTLTVFYTFNRLTSGRPSSGGGGGSRPASNEVIRARTAKSVGWSNITNEIKAASAGAVIEITLNDETLLPEDALKAAVDRKVKLILNTGYGRAWTIDGAKAVYGK